MTTESDSKTSRDSQKYLPGWLARCGITLPILYVARLYTREGYESNTLTHRYRSVRDRHGSPDDPNRLVMTVADSPKKRKRAVSPLSTKRMPIRFEEPKPIDMLSESTAVRALFDAALGDVNEIKAYSANHAHLIEQEESDAWDREARPRAKSKDDQTERRAAVIIRAIREYERKDVFGNLASEAIPGAETRDMGGQFLTNKDRIDFESLLYKISIRVPKGGLLHLHFNSELHPERLLEQARSIDNLYIRSIRPLLGPEDLDLTETVFNVLDPNMVEKGVGLFSPDYPGNATNWKTDEWKWKVWMPWKSFRDEFMKHFPNRYVQPKIVVKAPHSCSDPALPESESVPLDPAENWLKSKMVLSQAEAYGFTQTVNG
jgi:adenosine deaminase CECR1